MTFTATGILRLPSQPVGSVPIEVIYTADYRTLGLYEGLSTFTKQRLRLLPNRGINWEAPIEAKTCLILDQTLLLKD